LYKNLKKGNVMFKKLQNLLFEDEDDDIVNEEGQGTAMPQQQPVQAQPAAVKPAAPVQPEVRPAAPAPVPADRSASCETRADHAHQ
jgi:hypothetical protein